MKFKIWLEQSEKNIDFYKNLITKLLGVSQEGGGLSQEIKTYNTKELLSKIQSLGEFQQLPAEIQQSVSNRIRIGEGTLEDLAKEMLGETL